MSAITYVLIGLVPLGILNFVLKWRSVKKVAVKSFHHLSRKLSEITNALSSSSDNRMCGIDECSIVISDKKYNMFV